MENEVIYIKLDDIIPNRFQPREIFDEKALNELADSIRQHGVLEPIIVRPVSDNKFEIVAGERRYKASALAGLTKIPCIVRADLDDKESSLVAFIENEHRRDVSVIEKARTLSRLLKTNNMTQEELAKSIGISQSTLANRLRLLELPIEIQESLMKNEISERHARSLLSIKDSQEQIELLKRIKENKMTVRELEGVIKDMNNEYQNNNNFSDINEETKKIDNSPSNNEFISYLNNYNSKNDNVTENSTMVEFDNSKENNEFINFLNNYDNSMNTQMNNNPEEKNNENEFLNFDDYSQNNNPNEDNANVSDNNEFMSFLNNYNNDTTLSQDNKIIKEESNDDNEFMSFLNNYENKENDIKDNSVVENNPSDNKEESFNNNIEANNISDLGNFLNNYNNNQNTVLQQNINSNLLINDVKPPITTSFNANEYVEDNPNYVDVSKNNVINTVDGIINELKVTIDKIKSESKFKIETEEINFDDIYQITIKVDKRDF